MSYNHIFSNAETECEVVKTKRSMKGRKDGTQDVDNTGNADVVDIEDKEDGRKFSKELAALNYGLVMREREVAKRAEARGIDAYEEAEKRKVQQAQRVSKLSEVFDMVDNEIKATLKKTSWKRLSGSYRLKFIKDYIKQLSGVDRNGKKQVISEVTKLGVENLDKVEYSMDSTRVVRLNIVVDGVGKV